MFMTKRFNKPVRRRHRVIRDNHHHILHLVILFVVITITLSMGFYKIYILERFGKSIELCAILAELINIAMSAVE